MEDPALTPPSPNSHKISPSPTGYMSVKDAIREQANVRREQRLHHLHRRMPLGRMMQRKLPVLVLRLRGGRGSAPAQPATVVPPTAPTDDTDYLTALPQCVITVILRLLPGHDLLAAKMAHRSLGGNSTGRLKRWSIASTRCVSQRAKMTSATTRTTCCGR
mgnify:CR=1 FL=1